MTSNHDKHLWKVIEKFESILFCIERACESLDKLGELCVPPIPCNLARLCSVVPGCFCFLLRRQMIANKNAVILYVNDIISHNLAHFTACFPPTCLDRLGLKFISEETLKIVKNLIHLRWISRKCWHDRPWLDILIRSRVEGNVILYCCCKQLRVFVFLAHFMTGPHPQATTPPGIINQGGINLKAYPIWTPRANVIISSWFTIRFNEIFISWDGIKFDGKSKRKTANWFSYFEWLSKYSPL